MVTYNELGLDRQLNEIVVAGSHDAGITSGEDNVRTQSGSIAEQATAGVRVFDLRIAAGSTGIKVNGEKSVALHAFHADGKLMTNESKTRYLEDVGRVVKLTRTALKRGGAFGIGLEEMLTDAKDFVSSRAGSKEFLILKFDKCQNWALIAEACIATLGDRIYRGGGNLNTTTLRKLAGKVIVLFSPKGLTELGMPKAITELGGHVGASEGILGFRNLYDKEHGASGYNSSYPGLQYYGKGGTSVVKPRKKLGQNERKQGKLLAGGQMLANPEVMA